MPGFDPYAFRRRKAARLGAGTRRTGVNFEVNVTNAEGFDRGGVVLRRSSPGYEGKVTRTKVGDTRGDSWVRGVNGESHPFYDHKGRALGRNPATTQRTPTSPKPRGLHDTE